MGFALATSVHYGALLTLTTLGLNCVALSFATGWNGTHALNLALGVELSALLLLARLHAARGAPLKQQLLPFLGAESTPIYVGTLLASAVIAIRFFTPDLVPSSMTGDPPRHLLGALEFGATPFANYKPIYRTLLGLQMQLAGAENDQAFVGFNVILFGVLNASSMLFALSPANGRLPAYLLAGISAVVTGYSLFALIYGYLTLMLSASFALSAFVALRSYAEAPRRSTYWLAVAMICGSALSHAFLVPVLLVTFGISVGLPCRFRIVSWAKIAWPGLAVICTLTLISIWGLVGLSDSRIMEVVKAAGFVDQNIAANLWLPGILFATLALVHRKNPSFHIVTVVVASVAACLAVFVLLREQHLVAPYYANRLQIVMLPLLIAGCTEGLMRLDPLPGWPRQTLVAAIAATQFFFCFGLVQTPLSGSTIDFSELRWSEESIFAQNRALVSHSPLQFTAHDRERLRAIGSGEKVCVPPSVRRVPVIGTDHSAIWFEFYTGKIASYRDRRDGYIGGADYTEDVNDWLSGNGDPYIAIISHLHNLVLPRLVREVRKQGVLICRGDAFEIYRRPSSADRDYPSY